MLRVDALKPNPRMGIENPCVGGSIPPQATKYMRPSALTGSGAFSLAVSIPYITNGVIFTVYFLHLDIFQSLKTHSYFSLPTFSGFTFQLNFFNAKVCIKINSKHSKSGFFLMTKFSNNRYKS